MFESVQNIHAIGASGIGMSAAVKWLKARGKSVTESDLHLTGHAPENVVPETQMVLYSSAVPEDNVERAEARSRGIPEMSYAEFLGELTALYSSIVVCGTNGKSTTTALLGLMLEAGGYDPTVIVGSLVPGFGMSNLRVGKGRFLVVEGCEYKGNILHLNPEMAVVTNIEEDHLDYFRDLAHIRETFQQFVDKLKGKGLCVWNADDPESRKLNIDRGVTFAMESEADYRGVDRVVEAGRQSVHIAGQKLPLQIPGAFNTMNALAATAAAMELGVPFETCARVAASFTGIWRRFERVGVWKGSDVISDYGHHPTAIRSTIEAAREFFPNRRIVHVFQPHQHSRTKTLLAEFIEALPAADHVIVPEIYKVVGRTEKEEKEVSSRDLVDGVKRTHPDKDIRYAADLDAAESILRDIVQPTDVVIIQGAGDVDSLARKLAV